MSVANDENMIIANNDELISFDYYMRRLFEIVHECNHENYMCEVIIPLLRSCCIDDVKLVPVFDDRASGPKTENDTEIKKRMKIICAPKADGETYVVPDYIFVPSEYSFSNPMSPFLMVETKKPIIFKDGIHYRDLGDQIKDNIEELKAEIEAFNSDYVIFTDGITWMFLTIDNGIVSESKNYQTIRLVNQLAPYYSGNEISIKKTDIEVDLSIIGAGVTKVSIDPKEWNELRLTIKRLLEEIKQKVPK